MEEMEDGHFPGGAGESGRRRCPGPGVQQVGEEQDDAPCCGVVRLNVRRELREGGFARNGMWRCFKRAGYWALPLKD